jgi:hypothetical protein
MVPITSGWPRWPIEHLARLGLRRHVLRHAVGGENHRPVGRAFVQFLDKHRAHAPKALDHMAVVDDLVAHIDRCAVLLDRPLDDLDRPVDAGAKAARTGQQDAKGRADRRGGVHPRNLGVCTRRRHCDRARAWFALRAEPEASI